MALTVPNLKIAGPPILHPSLHRTAVRKAQRRSHPNPPIRPALVGDVREGKHVPPPAATSNWENTAKQTGSGSTYTADVQNMIRPDAVGLDSTSRDMSSRGLLPEIFSLSSFCGRWTRLTAGPRSEERRVLEYCGCRPTMLQPTYNWVRVLHPERSSCVVAQRSRPLELELRSVAGFERPSPSPSITAATCLGTGAVTGTDPGM
ncbi:unnamed protein product [Lota lota]